MVGVPAGEAVVDLAVACGWLLIYTVAKTGAASRYGGTLKGDGGALGSPMDTPGAQDIP